MAKKIRVWDGTAWQDVAPSLPYTAIHSAQASMPLTGVDGQVWLDTDGTLAGQDFVPLSGGTMTGNLNVPSINSGSFVKNPIINSAFDVWQRGTSFTSAGFLADRWRYYGAAAGTGSFSRVLVQGSTGLPGDIKYALRYNFTVAGAGYFANFIEGVGWGAGRTVTLSFYARNNSGLAKTFGWEAVQLFGTGGSSPTISYSSAATIPANSDFARYSVQFNLPSISGKTIGSSEDDALVIRFYDIGVANIDMTGFQLEFGNTMTPYSRNTSNQQTELSACHRYFRRYSGEQYYVLGQCSVIETTTAEMNIFFPTQMRVAPSMSSTGSQYLYINGSLFYPSLVLAQSFPYQATVQFNTSGMTRGQSGRVTGNTTYTIDFSAEL